MNERIIKLSEHANDYANHLDKIGVDDGWQNIFNQKFAQLIVQECARLNKHQSHELMGVITDVEEGDGFDDDFPKGTLH